MNDHTLKSELAIQLGELLEPLEGKTIHIQEWLTRDRSRGYDRHCSIMNSFEITVERVAWQMSGGHFYIYGKEPLQYAFLTGELYDIYKDKNKYVIIERYEEKTERKTVLVIC